ncbi:MAG: ABC transporter substrate-binding protein [Synergistaceae bacterium]|nr:ABC transporter substrate-binding protein [Synergistaceae bacterium]
MLGLRKIYTVLTLAILTFVFFGLTSSIDAAETITLGWYGPTSGAAAQDGQEGRAGAELAVELVNASGGINGKQLVMIYADDKSDPKEGANIATMFVSNKDIIGVVGPFNSSVILAAAPIFNRGKLCDIGWGVTSPLITTAGEYIYRVAPTDAWEADFISKWIADEGYKKVAFLYENTDYGVGMRDVIRKSLPGYGCEIVFEEPYVQGQTKDFGSIIASLKQAAPDAVFMGAIYNEAALLMTQARDLGFNAPFFGTDGFFSAGLLDLGGGAVEGARCCSAFFTETASPVVREFIDAYVKKFDRTPGNWAAQSYDGVIAYVEALKKSGASTREEVKKALDALGPFEGATGINEFDENGDVRKDLVKLVVKEGKFALYD